MAFRAGSTTGNSESLQDKCFKLLVQPDRVSYVPADLGLRDTVHSVLGSHQETVRMRRTDFEVPQNTSSPNTVVCSLWQAGAHLPEDSRDLSHMNRQDFSHSWQQNHGAANTIMVYCHSQSGCRVEGTFLVEYCAQRRMDLLLFDFPGCGQSSGDYVTLGWNEAVALSTVIEYAQQNFRVATQKIILWGRSMGSVAAMRFITHESALLRMSGAYLVGLILDSPYADLMELTRYTAQSKLNIPSLLLSVPIMILSGILKERVGLDLLSFKPIDMASSLVMPTLFLVAKGDKLLPKNTVQRIYSQCQSQMKLMEYCEGEHGSVRDKETLQRIFGFIDSICPVEQNYKYQHSRTTGYDTMSQGNSSIQKGITPNILSTSMAGPQLGSNELSEVSDHRIELIQQNSWSVGDGSLIREVEQGPGLHRFSSALSYAAVPTRQTQHMRVTSDYRDTSMNRQSIYFDPFLREASRPREVSSRATQEHTLRPGSYETTTGDGHSSRPRTKIDLRQDGPPRPRDHQDPLGASILASSGLREGSFVQDHSVAMDGGILSDHNRSGVRRTEAGQKKFNPLLRSFNQQPTQKAQVSIDQRLADSPINYKNGLGSASAVNIGIHKSSAGIGADPSKTKFREFMHNMDKSNTLETLGNPLKTRIFGRGNDLSGHDSQPRILGFGDSKPFMTSMEDNRTFDYSHNQHTSLSRPSLYTTSPKQPIAGPKINPMPIQSLLQNKLQDFEPDRPQVLSPQSKVPGAPSFQTHVMGMKSLDMGRMPLFRPNPAPVGSAAGFKQNKASHFFNSVDLSAVQQSSDSKDPMPAHLASQSRIHTANPTFGQGLAKAVADRPQSTLMDVFHRKRSNNQTDQPPHQSSYLANKDPYLLYSQDTRKTPVFRQAAPAGQQDYRIPVPSMNELSEPRSDFESAMQNAGLAQPKHLLGNLSVNTLSEFRGTVPNLNAISKAEVGWTAPEQLPEVQAGLSNQKYSVSNTARPMPQRNPLLTARLSPVLNSSYLR